MVGGMQLLKVEVFIRIIIDLKGVSRTHPQQHHPMPLLFFSKLADYTSSIVSPQTVPLKPHSINMHSLITTIPPHHDIVPHLTASVGKAAPPQVLHNNQSPPFVLICVWPHMHTCNMGTGHPNSITSFMN